MSLLFLRKRDLSSTSKSGTSSMTTHGHLISTNKLSQKANRILGDPKAVFGSYTTQQHIWTPLLAPRFGEASSLTEQLVPSTLSDSSALPEQIDSDQRKNVHKRVRAPFQSEKSPTPSRNVTTHTRPPSTINDDLKLPLQPVIKKKKVCTRLSSDSDDASSVENDHCQVVQKRGFVCAPTENTDVYWNVKTKQAVKEQFERDARIKAQQDREELARIERVRKQHMYNGELLDAHQEQESMEFELVLETNAQTSDIIIQVALMLVIHMKPHQIDGVKFLWNQVFESTDRIAASIDNETKTDTGGSGAVLAHCMGLGKTFTTIALIHTLFRYSKLTHIHRVLILCPLNTAINWKNEFYEWLHDLEPTIKVYLFNGDDIRTEDRGRFLSRWYETGGVLLMGYEMYRLLTFTSDDKPCKDRKPTLVPNGTNKRRTELADIENYRKYLRSPGPDLIVCDEGHMIKNPKSAIACSLNKIRTRRRIVLTGTPMQNNLKEYFSMVNFCKPNFLGTKYEFSCNYRIPIEAGQHRDSSPHDFEYMRRRVYALNQRMQTVIHRRGFDVLRAFLPPKFEYAVKIKCRPLQQTLYQTYLERDCIDWMSTKLNMAKLFADYQYLMKIWTHPWLLRPHFIANYNKREDPLEMDEFFQDDLDDSDFIGETQKCTLQSIQTTRNIVEQPVKTISLENVLNAMKFEWWFDNFDLDKSQFDLELSGKFLLLKAILDECESIGDKLLVFTRSLIALDYMEQWLAHWNVQTPSIQWQKGVDYFRMDGKVPIKQRAADMKLFNNGENSRARLFLISTMAGGMGINLFSANRVIIFDTSWNPAHDLQAMFRSYRLGQKKPVYIYRIIVKGTMEEKIYKRQITKQAMSYRVVDAKQLDRHFTHDELAQLYRFEPDVDNDPLDTYDADRVKDKVLRRLINEYTNTIVSYREHDSFLIHHDEYNLTMEEQKLAKDEEELTSTRLRQR